MTLAFMAPRSCPLFALNGAFCGWPGRAKRGHERGAMNVSLMELRDPQDDVLLSSLAQTGVS